MASKSAKPTSKTRKAQVESPAAVMFGEHSEAVKDLQVFLRDQGYQIDDVNGYFDNSTRTAVSVFQGANGLPAHGHWDAATSEAVGGLLAQDGVVPFTE